MIPRAAYECYLNRWILPRWGDLRIDQVKSVAVEEWLDSIKRAKGTRAKIRNIMSSIFHHAMRYEWVERNPIKLVRQSAKRERTPEILELAELQPSSQQAVGPGAHLSTSRRGDWASGQRNASISLERCRF
jgi:site-specific recombinase XerD